MTKRAGWCVAIVILAAGCDGEGGGDAGGLDGGADAAVADAGADDGGALDGGAATLADAWCPDFAARFCAAGTRCGCDPIPGYGDAAACLERAERGCRAGLARFDGDPRIELATEVPAGCVAALDEALARCAIPEPDLFAVRCPLVWPRDLSRALPGAGMACVEGLCAEGARCSSMGACAAPAPGASCAGDTDCRDGERCAEGTCRPLDLTGTGASCAGPDECTGDARCLAATRRECEALVPRGACTGDEGCVEGEYCAAETCAPSPGLGLACGNGVACAAGLACRFTGAGEGTCQPMPGDGEPCALGTFGPILCGDGLACREGTCGAPPGDGEPCAMGVPFCADGLGCFFEGPMSVCRPRAGAGAECGTDDSCGAGLFCDFGEGRCAPFFAVGEVCTDGNECGPDGACVPDETATTFRCVPRPGEGDACFLDDTCDPGFACRSPFEAGLCAPPMCMAFVF